MTNNDDISKGMEPVPILSELNISEALKDQGFQPTVVDHSVATVIRIKRKLTEEPAEALLFTCKRKRFLDKENEETNIAATDVDKNVFHFATTLKCKASLDTADEAKVQDAISLRKHLRKGRFHCKNIDNSSPTIQHGVESLQSKLKSVVIGQKRTTNEPVTDCSSSKHPARQRTPSPVKNKNQFKLHEEQHKGDAPSTEVVKSNDQNNLSENDIYCNSVKLVREKNTAFEPPKDEFVYDVYFCLRELDWRRQDILDMKPCKYEDFVWDSPAEEAQTTYDDEDDSNDEDNWRNDYPDEEDSFDENFRISDEEEGNYCDDYDGFARYRDIDYNSDCDTYHGYSYSDEDY